MVVVHLCNNWKYSCLVFENGFKNIAFLYFPKIAIFPETLYTCFTYRGQLYQFNKVDYFCERVLWRSCISMAIKGVVNVHVCIIWVYCVCTVCPMVVIYGVL